MTAPAYAVELTGVCWGPKGRQDILSDISFAVPQGAVVTESVVPQSTLLGVATASATHDPRWVQR